MELRAGSGYARLVLILITVAVLLLFGILAAVVIQDQSLFSAQGTTIETVTTPRPTTTEPTTTRPTTEPMPPETTTPGAGYDEFARILKSLPLANVAFNAPTTLQVHEATVIQLLVSLEKPISDLQDELDEAGEQEGASAHVTPRMEARLTGHGFKIDAITEETQAVVRGATTEWKWDVEAVETGNQRLHLTLTALLEVNRDQTHFTIRTFDKTVAIDVTLTDRVTGFFNANWQWLWAFILVPLAGLVWKAISRRRNSRL